MNVYIAIKKNHKEKHLQTLNKQVKKLYFDYNFENL